MGWIHKPKTVLISFQDKDKQNILGIVCGTANLPCLFHIREDAGLHCLLDCVSQKIFRVKIFHDGVNFQQFQIFYQGSDLPSFVEEFCQVKLVWVKGEVTKAGGIT